MELRAVFLAEYFDVDHAGKFFVGGGFSQVTADEFPAALGADSKLIVVIDADHGEPDPGLTIEIRARGVETPLASNDFPISGIDAPAPKKGSAATHAIRVSLNQVVLPSQGHYYFDVHLGGQLKQSLRLVASEQERSEGEENEQSTE